LLRGRLLVPGYLQHALLRTGRYVAEHLSPVGRCGRRGPPRLRRKASHATDPESQRDRRPARPSIISMSVTIHSTFLPPDDPEKSLAFYRDALGFEVRNDVAAGGKRWITVGPVDQPETSIVLHPPGVDPGLTEDERRAIAEMMAKGSYAT